MRTLAAVGLLILLTAGCAQPKSDHRVIDGVEVICTWSDHKMLPDRDLRCFPVQP